MRRRMTVLFFSLFATVGVIHLERQYSVLLRDKNAEVSEPEYALAQSQQGYMMKECNCVKHLDIQPSTEKIDPMKASACSLEANFLGEGQKVLSYSLYVNSPKDIDYYALGLEPNLKEIAKLYPHWYFRLYTNIDIRVNNYCDLSCKNDHLIWCDIHNIPQYGDLSHLFGKMWRFLPVGDPLVDTMLSRDLDGVVTFRERQAVAEWERSNYSIHMMRDIAIAHDTQMLAGMFGLKNNFEEAINIREQLLEAASVPIHSDWVGHDEWALRRVIYNTTLISKMLTHDSYTCEKYYNSVPFPTRRIGPPYTYVGNALRKRSSNFTWPLTPCPFACRPKYGQHWSYC